MSSDRDYERIFVADRQISITHFFAVNWTEDSERPILFAFGYWSHDGIFHQGLVGWDGEKFGLAKGAMEDHRITAVRPSKETFKCRICGADLGWDRPSGVCSESCLNSVNVRAMVNEPHVG